MIKEKMRKALALLRKLPLLSRLFLALFFVFSLVVVIIGLDNVYGLIAGMAAAASLVIELSRRWQRARSFLYLAGGSLLAAIFISGLYQEVAIPLALRLGGQGALDSLGWRIYHNIVSYGILLVTPGCIVVGLAGASVRGVRCFRDRWRRRQAASVQS